METFLIKAAQLLLSLSILVIVHEFGHFLFARLFKIRVEKFYLFFNPWFTLFKFKPKNSDTEYGLGWLPLGGYVKISGMMDESMDKEQLAQEPQPWEFRTKPAWQRLLVMVGGVLFNFILALFIYSMIIFSWGDTYLPTKNVKSGMYFPDAVKEVGFQDRDILVSADGQDIHLRDGVMGMSETMRFLDAKEITVLRNGQEVKVALPNDFAERVLVNRVQPFESFIPSVPINDVMPKSAGYKAGILPGDSIVKIDSVDIASYNAQMAYIAKVTKGLEKDQTVNVDITVFRDSLNHTFTATLDTSRIIGLHFTHKVDSAAAKNIMQTDKYSFLASFPAGANTGVQTLKGYVAQSRFIFTKTGAQNLGGFGALGKLFPAQWNWQDFWTMTAFLSIILAFMNILPIPMLDGGHIMFLLYEVITRRKPNEKFVEHSMTVGMVLLLLLLVYANGNDIFKAIFG